MAKKTYIVNHPKLNVAVERNGKTKIEQLVIGSEYSADEAAVKSLVDSGKLVLPSEAISSSAPTIKVKSK